MGFQSGPQLLSNPRQKFSFCEAILGMAFRTLKDQKIYELRTHPKVDQEFRSLVEKVLTIRKATLYKGSASTNSVRVQLDA